MRIETGNHGASKNDPKWKLLSGHGVRQTQYFVPFKPAYRRPPKVQAALARFDILKGANHRLTVTVDKVLNEGFFVSYTTWANTQVWSAGISYIAIGDTRRDEDVNTSESPNTYDDFDAVEPSPE